MSLRTALFLALLSLGALPAVADDRCTVPLADWQPREALQKKLEADGWTILSIRAHDGCYGVVARDPRGATVKSRFDPATLERVERGDGRHGHDDHREDD
mgnify:CR=1 FL=1